MEDLILSAYIKDAKRYPRITEQREKELSNIIQHGENSLEVQNAEKELVEANLLLVIREALHYYNTRRYVCDKLKISVDDLIANGNVILMRVAKNFDSNKAKFSTYLVASMKSAFNKTIYDAQIVKIPSYHKKLWYLVEDLKAVYGDNISDEFIADELDINIATASLITKSKNVKFVGTLEDIENWNDLIADPKSDDRVVNNSLKEYIMGVIRDVLNDRERDIMEDYVDNDISFSERGKKFGVSKERIRQIIERCKRKLRYKIIRDFDLYNPIIKTQIENLREEYAKKMSNWEYVRIMREYSGETGIYTEPHPISELLKKEEELIRKRDNKIFGKHL